MMSKPKRLIFLFLNFVIFKKMQCATRWINSILYTALLKTALFCRVVTRIRCCYNIRIKLMNANNSFSNKPNLYSFWTQHTLDLGQSHFPIKIDCVRIGHKSNFSEHNLHTICIRSFSISQLEIGHRSQNRVKQIINFCSLCDVRGEAYTSRRSVLLYNSFNTD